MARAIISECIRSADDLLHESWDEIESMKEENDGRIKVSLAFLISYKGNEQAVKSTLTYGRKVTESRESIINPDQLQMFDGSSPQNGEPAAGAPDEGEDKRAAGGLKKRRKPFQESVKGVPD
jgi:hypothetical protein